MGVFVNILKHTIFYRIYDCADAIKTYSEDKKIVSDTLQSKEFHLVIKNYLHADLRKNWFGEVGCVINPYINDDGQFDMSNVVFEVDDDNTNTNEYVKFWVYNKMKLIQDLFKLDKLYDYINITFEHVGPEGQDNYLIMFKIASREWFVDAIKKLFWHMLGLTAIVTPLLYYFKIITL